MNFKLNKNQIERFSRQIILKDIGILGQKKIILSKVLIIGMGGLGCPVAEFLTRAGIGYLGIVDFDNALVTTSTFMFPCFCATSCIILTSPIFVLINVL